MLSLGFQKEEVAKTLKAYHTTIPNIPPVTTALTHLVNMIRQGTAPGVDLLCACRLIGLQKPDGGVRPIAVGDLIYKVALKAILITSFRPSMLLPCQLGVSTPGGVEPIIFLLDEATNGPNTLKTQ